MKFEAVEEFRKDRQRSYSAIALAVAALAVLAYMVASQAEPGAYALWILGGAMAFFTLKQSAPGRWKFDRFAAWVAGVAALLLTMVSQVPANWVLFPALLALLTWIGGARLALRLAVPVFLFVVLIPATEYLYVLLSFPLSWICAALTVFILRVFGVDCGFDHAIIQVGASRVAVTPACSGIELLEAMLLLGWIIVRMEQKRFSLRLIHYLTLLPIIILCNTLRLVFVIGLSLWIGDRAFDNTLHVILGYVVVVASVALLFVVGKLWQEKGKPSDV